MNSPAVPGHRAAPSQPRRPSAQGLQVLRSLEGDGFDGVCGDCGDVTRIHPDEPWVQQVVLLRDQHRHATDQPPA